MDRNDHNQSRTDEMMVIFGVFSFEGGQGPQAYLGRGLSGLPGMAVRPSHDSPIELVSGYQAVSMAIRPEWDRVYARAITDLAYLKAAITALEFQKEFVRRTEDPKIPSQMNVARIIPVLDFQWNIKHGHMTVNATWGAGLRSPQGHLSTGTPVFAHKDDPVKTAGFHLVEIDVGPSMRYLFARPCRNERLLDLVIHNLSDQMTRVIQAGLDKPQIDSAAEA